MALIDRVKTICNRLAPLGWRDLLLHVTSDQLDIAAPNLAAELTKILSSIDRTQPGFEDFSIDGTKGIFSRSPSRSLLYHALASPLVVNDQLGAKLGGFPTLAEIEVVENYVFGVSPPRIQDLLTETGASKLSVVVFAFEYRTASNTCSRRRADMVYSRTGIARVGTAEAQYIPEVRGFWPEDESNPRSIRAIPSRFAAYLAVKEKGNNGEFLPMRFQSSDDSNQFWVPVHKLFEGDECLRGLNLNVSFNARHYNDKIRRVHMLAHPNLPDPPEISPYRFFEGIAELSQDADLGSGLLSPVAHSRLVEPAFDSNGEPLAFRVPQNPTGFASFESPNGSAPAYIHARTKVENGVLIDLNDEVDVNTVVRSGGYDALNYIDFTGEGEVGVSVPQLENESRIDTGPHPAYSLAAAPDFFPSAGQRELSEWSESNSVPASIRGQVWGVRPAPLCDVRLPANLQFPDNSFDVAEKTVTALIPLWETTIPSDSPKSSKDVRRATYLADDAAGIFAPGWAVSQDTNNNVPHLASYGLGSPFPEDAKLCSALSTFWPAVAPDTARGVSPHTGNSNLLGTVAPMTDEEIGQVGNLPWDGIPGPKIVSINGVEFAECASFLHVDYIESALNSLFSVRLTSRVDAPEYERRVLTMGLAYRAIAGTGNISAARNSHYILSFQSVSSGNSELQDAIQQTNTIVGNTVFRIDLSRVSNVQDQPSPNDHRKRLLPIVGRRLMFVDPENQIVLSKAANQPAWSRSLG